MKKEKVMRGKVVKLGDYVNTNVMSPGQWSREGLEVLRLHTMEAIRKDFYKDVTPGSILVAGRNFGCGSHREPAVGIMKFMGISAIVADSVARIYYRNCIAFGLPVFAVDQISRMVEEGDEMEITMQEDGVKFRNLTRGKELSSSPIPEMMGKVLEQGGIYPLLKKRLEDEEGDVN